MATVDNSSTDAYPQHLYRQLGLTEPLLVLLSCIENCNQTRNTNSVNSPQKYQDELKKCGHLVEREWGAKVEGNLSAQSWFNKLNLSRIISEIEKRTGNIISTRERAIKMESEWRNLGSDKKKYVNLAQNDKRRNKVDKLRKQYEECISNCWDKFERNGGSMDELDGPIVKIVTNLLPDYLKVFKPRLPSRTSSEQTIVLLERIKSLERENHQLRLELNANKSNESNESKKTKKGGKKTRKYKKRKS
jgi:hypothetical protein